MDELESIITGLSVVSVAGYLWFDYHLAGHIQELTDSLHASQKIRSDNYAQLLEMLPSLGPFTYLAKRR